MLHGQINSIVITDLFSYEINNLESLSQRRSQKKPNMKDTSGDFLAWNEKEWYRKWYRKLYRKMHKIYINDIAYHVMNEYV